MKKFILMLLTFFVSNIAFSALPPVYQSIAELKAVLSDPRLSEKLEPGDIILEIKKTDTGYLIITNNRQIMAKLVFLPSDMPGPARFKVEF